MLEILIAVGAAALVVFTVIFNLTRLRRGKPPSCCTDCSTCKSCRSCAANMPARQKKEVSSHNQV